MEVLAQVGGSLLSGIIESVIKKIHENVLDDMGGSQSKLRYSLQELEDTMSTVKQLLSDADKRAYIDDDKQVENWLERLREVTYDVDKILDELEYKKLKRLHTENVFANYYHSHNPFHRFESAIIEKINGTLQRIKSILKNAKTYKLLKSRTVGSSSQGRITTSSTNNIANVFGRDAIRDEIIQLLTQENFITCDKRDIKLSAKKVSILSIVGIGGIGKTTLAQMVINDEKVKSHFDLKIWVCVSDDFNERKIIKQILESIYYAKRKGINKEGENMKVNSGDATMGNSETLDVLTKSLEDEIKGKTFLLVLDDVWNEDSRKWEGIENCLTIDDANKGSRILVTTRSELVARIMSSSKTINLDGLDDDVFWALFKQCAFGTIDEYLPELEETGKKIASKLKGSPLAAKTVGHILRSNISKRHWETILNSEMWRLKQDESGIMAALKLSYQYLPEHLKPCFAFCSLYPKDFVYEKKRIVYMWIALDYVQKQDRDVPMEEIGEEYVNELLDRSMLQPCIENDVSIGGLRIFEANEVFKVHDLIHDLSKMVSANESLMIEDEYTMKRFSSSIRNVSIFINNDDWEWNGPDGFDQFNNIRTLIFLNKDKMSRDPSYNPSFGIYDFLEKIVAKMKFLRVLDLSYIRAEYQSLPKLKHLRYLDLYQTRLEKLPSSFSKLYQLQILNCDRIERPPQIKFMKNLRHIRGFRVNTNAIQNLENFHFLQEVELDVSKQTSSFLRKEKRRDTLKVLQVMRWMRELSIYGLENVESKEEALEAELKSKDRLTRLTLSWASDPKGSNVEEILEALHPGPNVAALEIERYNGAVFPNWMENLSSLRELVISLCDNIKFNRTTGLKMIKHLRFYSCEHLGIQDGSEGFRALTSLETLNIVDCPQLTSDLFEEGRGGLPSSLKEMFLETAADTVINVSSTILWSLTNLTRLTVLSRGDGSVTPTSTNAPETQQLQQLREFEFRGKSAQQLKRWLLQLQGCTSLAEVYFFEGLECFDKEMEDALISFVSLRLLLYDSSHCRSLPTRLCEMASLRELYIYECPKIECLPERGLPAGLQVLYVNSCPLLEEHLAKVRHELPDQLRVVVE